MEHERSGDTTRRTDREPPHQSDIELSRRTWNALAERVRTRCAEGAAPSVAWRDAVAELTETPPNIVVDGETKALEDIDGIGPLPDPHGEPTTDGVDAAALQTAAYVAVDLLAGAIEDVYRPSDVEDAAEHLATVVENAAEDTTATGRVRRALEHLDARGTDSHVDVRRLEVRNALAELAPVAAGVIDAGPHRDGTDAPGDALGPRTDADQVGVPVFYALPERAADRAIERFQERLDAHRAGDVDRGHACLREYIYDEIVEQPVIYVDDTPLAEYASGRVPVLNTADLDGQESVEEGHDVE